MPVLRSKSPATQPGIAILVPLVLASWLAGAVPAANATTVAQNVSWTIDRDGTDEKVRIVAYGDSIFAGYYGSIQNVAVWAAPGVEADYLSAFLDVDVEVIRRTKSGAKADDIYENKIVDDASWMQAPGTRVVAFEMCGNDALQARTAFLGQGGTCDYSGLDAALAACTTYQEQAMEFIDANASPDVRLKIVSNLYYAGYDADDEEAGCTDPETKVHPSTQDVFLGYLARMNWRACDFALQYGFRCADTFAQFMGADRDTDGDGEKDSLALRWRPGESEEDYVTRLLVTQRSTIRDANTHLVGSQTSFDYLQSDDTHPTHTGQTVFVGLLGGTGNGESGPRFAPDQTGRARNPVWRRFGHERMGHALAKFHRAQLAP